MPEKKDASGQEPQLFRRVRNAVILPDGSKPEPMGSGIITGLLGVGGMANVYDIWNSQLEINRAVKLLHPNYTEEAKQRFQTEIKITAKLHHPNIIEIHAVGQWNNLPYIEMERIEGHTLEKLIVDRGALPVEVCTSIGIMIGRALRYAHNQEYVIYGKTYHGVIHRDLKPSNIMVATNGSVKLMDFGIARPTDASIHTTDGSILGTMQYLSPEQLDGKEADIRTDIYSLGTILYELVTGVKAFPEHNVSKLMLSKIKNDFKSLEEFDVRIPPKFRRLMHRCMIHDREKRIANAAEFLSDLAKVHRSITALSPEQVMRQFMNVPGSERIIVNFRRRIPVRIISIAAGVVAILYGLVVVIPRISKSKESGTPPPPVIEVAQVREPPTKLPVSEPQPSPDLPPTVSKPADVIAAKRETRSVPAAQKAIAKPLSLKEKLKEQHGTDDLVSIFFKEIEGRRYTNALEIYKDLKPDEAHREKTAIFRMRALRELGRTNELQNFLASSEIKDGEFYLEKAKMMLAKGSIAQAMQHLKECERTPSAYLQSKTVRLERLYLTARCRTIEFDAASTAASKKAALDSWYEVRLELQTSQDHEYFKKSLNEMQRITAKK